MPIRRCAGLAAFAVAVALTSPVNAHSEAGDECGHAGDNTVTVAAGSISCADALGVINRYLTDPSVVRDGEWVRFDGWDCWTPSPEQQVLNAFSAECNRGVDDIQVRD
ncbi:hypothetical protein A5662_26385 [Mycobacteriaceae bacterium 1482268.1]|nr:hypothetical protein A5662_26385 [Mycobacteriaceae bacterium 1482268.1]